MIEIESKPGETVSEIFIKAFHAHLNVNDTTIDESRILSKVGEFVGIPTKSVMFKFNGSYITITE